ncbi:MULTISPECIES: hypothetical protein [unclassified Bradyrhizobium]|uniref:hypothetical protein n=1 Tax=unclassified Bradyrhizobium TaxID=2631580 RepID=UPI00291658C5|nr:MULTISPECIES: hypothetical protein [unclassified Bradyrhizobium]
MSSGIPQWMMAKWQRFVNWNGDPPAPEFSHWTGRGVFTIRAQTPGKACAVLFNERLLGYGDYLFLYGVASNLHRGSYDKELGFEAASLVPGSLEDWNNMGGGPGS